MPHFLAVRSKPRAMMTVSLFYIVSALVLPFTAAAESHAHIHVEPNGRLRIATEDGREIIPQKSRIIPDSISPPFRRTAKPPVDEPCTLTATLLIRFS